MTDFTLKTVQALARRCLWIAYCWNDHNFDAAYTYARETAKEHGINSLEDANTLIAQMQREPDTEHMLRNLLAVIHRDGGQYAQEHGLQKASDDAEAVVVNWHAQCDAAAIDAAMGTQPFPEEQ